jgi:hypothetical protein
VLGRDRRVLADAARARVCVIVPRCAALCSVLCTLRACVQHRGSSWLTRRRGASAQAPWRSPVPGSGSPGGSVTGSLRGPTGSSRQLGGAEAPGPWPVHNPTLRIRRRGLPPRSKSPGPVYFRVELRSFLLVVYYYQDQRPDTASWRRQRRNVTRQFTPAPIVSSRRTLRGHSSCVAASSCS